MRPPARTAPVGLLGGGRRGGIAGQPTALSDPGTIGDLNAYPCSSVVIPERPVPSARLLDRLRRRHGLAWAGDPVDLGGSSSLNLLLRDARGDVVVRVHRAWLAPAR